VSVALVVFAYLCGSIPSGVLLARSAGVDVRRVGSRNIGATNVARAAGLRLGLATLLADVAKGVLPVTIARATGMGDATAAFVAVAAFLGHLFPPVLGFAGGKGVSTALGVSLALYPLATVPAVAAFTATVFATGFVSLGSMIAIAIAPVAVLVFGYPVPDVAAAIVMACLVIVRHRENVVRLLAGTEPKALPRKQAAPRK
jgi:glycerol-3-phosphate acyltransferase PlsY